MSLLTVGPGEDLYSVFGHTAIRVNDPAQNIDVTFGWGGFRYEDNFYVKFLRGTLPYYIHAYDMYPFLYAYQAENRTVREQVLNLSPVQKQQLYAVLLKNMQPENRTYQYKFFYDNCATRPRDKLAEGCGDSLTIPSRTKMTGKSYRDWMNIYLDKSVKPWAKLGMNLAIGQPADVKTDGWHAMYLPDQVHDQMAQATIKKSDGRVEPLVSSDQTLFEARRRSGNRYRCFSILVLFLRCWPLQLRSLPFAGISLAGSTAGWIGCCLVFRVSWAGFCTCSGSVRIMA